MKTGKLITALAALCATATLGIAHADVGMRDSKPLTRAEVRADLMAAKAQGLAGVDQIDGLTAGTPVAGAAGPAGSRFSTRTREEVRAELEEDRTIHGRTPRSPDDIYFGD